MSLSKEMLKYYDNIFQTDERRMKTEVNGFSVPWTRK